MADIKVTATVQVTMTIDGVPQRWDLSQSNLPVSEYRTIDYKALTAALYKIELGSMENDTGEWILLVTVDAPAAVCLNSTSPADKSEDHLIATNGFYCANLNVNYTPGLWIRFLTAGATARIQIWKVG
jgi:hypothetical protein